MDQAGRAVIRALWEATGGAALIVGFAAFWLWAMPPAHAAEACRGQWITTSWYGTESGSVTANGEHFDGTSMTAASRTLPFGTRLRVTYEGQSVLVVINDRGPYSKGRSLDLSRAAAERIGLIHAGVGRVCVEQIR